MATESKVAAEDAKIDLFEDDDEFEEFEIDEVSSMHSIIGQRLSLRTLYVSTVENGDIGLHHGIFSLRDLDPCFHSTLLAFQQEENAKHEMEANKERIGEFSKEIAAAQESLVHVKLAFVQAQGEHAKILSEKDDERQSARHAIGETQMKLESLKKEFDPEIGRNLDRKLAETAAEIEAFQKEIENAKNSDLHVVKAITSDLDDGKETAETRRRGEVS